jgi:hypothetical protein
MALGTIRVEQIVDCNYNDMAANTANYHSSPVEDTQDHPIK